MNKLELSIAVGNYDRMRPLIDGEVQIDGVDPVFMLHDPEEIFFRAFRHAEFDITELSLSSFSVKTAADNCPYVGVPVFPSRAFRHTSIYIRTDRGIETPADLRGKRIGVPEYQLTANVWARLFLEEDHGLKPSDVTWLRGGYEQPGRVEKINLNLPEGVHVENIPAGETLSGMLASGELDAVMGPRAPSCWLSLCRPATGRIGLVPAYRYLSDHAFIGHSQDTGRTSPLVAVFGLQGLRTVQGISRGQAQRYCRHESDATLR